MLPPNFCHLAPLGDDAFQGEVAHTPAELLLRLKETREAERLRSEKAAEEMRKNHFNPLESPSAVGQRRRSDGGGNSCNWYRRRSI